MRARWTPQPVFYNGACTTYFCMHMTQISPEQAFFDDVYTASFCVRRLSRGLPYILSALAFVSDSALWEGFNFYFQGVFC